MAYYKVSVAKILKNKPVGLKLYSNTFGYISFNVVHKDKIYFLSEDDYTHSVKSNGKMYDDGECVIFPSKEMRDWEKIAWKKGDVLAGAFGALCIFDKWANDDYTRFDAKFVTPKSRGTTFEVEDWCKITNEACIRQYIRDIEEDNGGKLNLTTLEVEKHQHEFKDGDIVFMKGIKGRYFANCIFILRSEYKDGDERAFYYAFYNADDKYTLDEYGNTKVHYSLRLATDSEKQQLFDALAKEGKAWNADKKMIVNLKTKVELKPFDKVLVRDSKSANWRANLFGYIGKDGYYRCVYANYWVYCIPYIGNEHLLGTTKDVED